ncbi:MAG: hypothetical protein PX638_23825 [Microcystis sp. M53599_WE4]|nr:hypothetical protein [Microcystis sp. M53599_WE4]
MGEGSNTKSVENRLLIKEGQKAKGGINDQFLISRFSIKYLPEIKKNDIRNPTKSNDRRGIASADSDR